MPLLINLLRMLAYCLSWLLVWTDQLADAIEYRQQTMQRLERELDHGPAPIPVPILW